MACFSGVHTGLFPTCHSFTQWVGMAGCPRAGISIYPGQSARGTCDSEQISAGCRLGAASPPVLSGLLTRTAGWRTASSAAEVNSGAEVCMDGRRAPESFSCYLPHSVFDVACPAAAAPGTHGVLPVASLRATKGRYHFTTDAGVAAPDRRNHPASQGFFNYAPNFSTQPFLTAPARTSIARLGDGSRREPCHYGDA